MIDRCDQQQARPALLVEDDGDDAAHGDVAIEHRPIEHAAAVDLAGEIEADGGAIVVDIGSARRST